jgi:hypothetical protein
MILNKLNQFATLVEIYRIWAIFRFY